MTTSTNNTDNPLVYFDVSIGDEHGTTHTYITKCAPYIHIVEIYQYIMQLGGLYSNYTLI